MFDQLFHPLSPGIFTSSEVEFGTETYLGGRYTVKLEEWKDKPKTISDAHSKDWSDYDSSKFDGTIYSIKVGIPPR